MLIDASCGYCIAVKRCSTDISNNWCSFFLGQCATCRNMRWNGHLTLIFFADNCCATGFIQSLRFCCWFAKRSHPHSLHVSLPYLPVCILFKHSEIYPIHLHILGSPFSLQQVNCSCTCKNTNSTDYFWVPCTTTCRWSTASRYTFVCACMAHVTISVCRCFHCDSISLLAVSIPAYSLADSFLPVLPYIHRRLAWECNVVNSYVVRCHLIPSVDRKLHNTHLYTWRFAACPPPPLSCPSRASPLRHNNCLT